MTQEEECPKGYATEAQTKALLEQGRNALALRMSRKDMLSPDDFAKKFFYRNGEEVGRFVKEHFFLGVECDGKVYLPNWQAPILKEIQELLAEANSDHTTVFSFLESRHDALEGLTIRQAIEQGFNFQSIKELFYG